MTSVPLRAWQLKDTLWHQAEVLAVLVSRDHRARYKSTMMGMFWAVASPMLFLLTFYFLFGLVMWVEIENYASYVFAGLIAWTWMQTSLHEGVSCISQNGSLVAQPGFPVSTLPAVPVVSNFVNFVFSLPLLIAVLLAEQGYIGWTILLLPLLLFVQLILQLSLVYFLSALNVVFRDVQYMLPALLQLGFFMTPIFYDIDQIPEPLRSLLMLNPMTPLVGAYRAIFAGRLPEAGGLTIVFLVSVVLLVLGYRYFQRAAERFLEEI